MTLPPFAARDWLTWSAEMAAQAAVLVTALRMPRRDRPHVPLFVFALASELYMRGVEWLYLEGVAVPVTPPVGASRALYHSVQALHAAWPAAVAALAWWVWRGPQKFAAPRSLCRGPGAVPENAGSASDYDQSSHQGDGRAILLTLPLPVKAISFLWLAFNAALIAAHPLPRGWTQPVLHVFAGLCVALGGLTIATGWARRHEHAAQVAGYLVVVELVCCTVGPWAGDVFRAWRTVGNGMYVVAFTLLAGWQWWATKESHRG